MDEVKAQAIIDAAHDLMIDKELIESPLEAKLALALQDYDPTFLQGKESCDCDSKEDCDECWSVSEKIAWLKEHSEK
jgi:hypothetical protein